MGREEEHEVFMVWYFSLVICLQKMRMEICETFCRNQSTFVFKVRKGSKYSVNTCPPLYVSHPMRQAMQQRFKAHAFPQPKRLQCRSGKSYQQYIWNISIQVVEKKTRNDLISLLMPCCHSLELAVISLGWWCMVTFIFSCTHAITNENIDILWCDLIAGGSKEVKLACS